MLALTLQIYNVGNWQDAMTVTFDEPERGFDSRCSFGYETSYLVEHIENIPSPFAGAVSATAPIAWECHESPRRDLAARRSLAIC